MTNYNERLEEVLSKTPCSQCDGSGAYPDYDGEPVQCQFCWQLRFTFIDKTKQAITSLIKELVEEVIGEDEWSGIFPAIGEPSAMRDDLRADQRTRLQSILKREFEQNLLKGLDEK